jgi:hypothetical protein
MAEAVGAVGAAVEEVAEAVGVEAAVEEVGVAAVEEVAAEPE